MSTVFSLTDMTVNTCSEFRLTLGKKHKTLAMVQNIRQENIKTLANETA